MSTKAINNDWNPVHFVSNNIKAYNNCHSLTIKIIAIVSSIFIGISSFGLICKLFLKITLPITQVIISPYSIAGAFLIWFSLINIYGCMLRK